MPSPSPLRQASEGRDRRVAGMATAADILSIFPTSADRCHEIRRLDAIISKTETVAATAAVELGELVKLRHFLGSVLTSVDGETDSLAGEGSDESWDESYWASLERRTATPWQMMPSPWTPTGRSTARWMVNTGSPTS